jgi:uncharacterized protein YabE (DUF348 family)/3D (Asp-Asp-Asp) domain-containing protein
VVVVAFVAFRAFPQRTITILDQGRSTTVETALGSEARSLQAAGVRLGPGDRVVSASGGAHTSVAIDRAVPVTIEADGAAWLVHTQASTVSGVLAEAGIDLRPGDVVYVNGRRATAKAPLAAALASLYPPPPGARLPAPAGTRIAVVRAVPVSVFVDTLRIDARTAAPTVAALLEELGMTVREEDLVRPGLDAPVTAGMSVHLAKAKSVHLVLDGKEQTLYTRAETVAEILRLLGIELGPEDVVSLPLDTPVENGLSLTIALTREVEETVEQPIQPPIVYESDPSLPPGSVRIIPGREGIRVIRYRVTYKNGQEVARVQLPGVTVVREPVPTRHISGPPSTGPSAPLDAPEYTGPYKRKITVVTTWYNASHGGKSRDDPSYGITATGVRLDKGICAVDPTVIPLGTWMYIPGYGLCLAADVGGGVKGYHVDLGFPESVGDPGWGKRVLDIYILE